MADLSNLADLPTASRIPADILERLTPAEAKHRAEYCYELESRAPVSGEVRTLMMDRSRRVLRSLPVREAVERHNDLHRLAGEMPNSGMGSPASDLRSAAAKIKQDNAYPPDLWNAAEKRLNGVAEVYYEGANLDAILGVDTAAEKGGSAPVVKSDLSRRIAQYQNAVYFQYLAAGMRPPFDLERS